MQNAVGESRFIKVSKKSEKEKIEKKKSIYSLSFDIGWSIALPIVGGVFLGQFLDERFGTKPKITLILIIVGVCIGLGNLIMLSRKAIKE